MLHASAGDTETAALLGECIKYLTDMAGQLVEALKIMNDLREVKDRLKAQVDKDIVVMKESIELIQNHKCEIWK